MSTAEQSLSVGWTKAMDFSNIGYAYSCKFDSAGNLFVSGVGYNVVSSSSGGDMIIKKFDSNGNEDIANWNKAIDISAGDIATALAIDSFGNVYVGGVAMNYVGAATSFDWVIKKFDKNGIEDTVHWNKAIDFNSGIDQIYSIAIEHDQNIYVGGIGTNVASGASGTDWVIKKFSANGVEDTINWNKVFDNGAGSSLRSLVIDSSGNLYAAGNGQNLVAGTSGLDWLIKKFSSTGIEDTVNWNKTFNTASAAGTEDDLCTAMVIDSNDCLYACGKFRNQITDASADDWAIKKFSSNGTEDKTFWNKVYDFGSNDYGTAVSIAPDGSIYFAAQIYNAIHSQSLYDCYIKKFNSNGIEDIKLWNKPFGGSTADYISNIAVDPWGNVYSVGSSINLASPTSLNDFVIRKNLGY
jgi:hypothetical protein